MESSAALYLWKYRLHGILAEIINKSTQTRGERKKHMRLVGEEGKLPTEVYEEAILDYVTGRWKLEAAWNKHINTDPTF